MQWAQHDPDSFHGGGGWAGLAADLVAAEGAGADWGRVSWGQEVSKGKFIIQTETVDGVEHIKWCSFGKIMGQRVFAARRPIATQIADALERAMKSDRGALGQTTARYLHGSTTSELAKKLVSGEPSSLPSRTANYIVSNLHAA